MTAGNSGFTAKVVARPGQRISHQRINATGCDVGIYVADRASHVTISGVTVTGANDAGILVQNTSHVTIDRSTVTGNGMNSVAGPNPPGTPPTAGELDQAFGISLFGVSDASVTRNTVYDNGRGGIGIMDDGPFDPGQVVGGPGTSPAAPVPVRNVEVAGNLLWANYNGCAIVVSAFNENNTVRNVDISRNTVIGTGFGAAGPDVGGIVAQSNGVGSTVGNITISGNYVRNSAEAGVIVHAAAPNSHTRNVQVTRNILSGNNWLFDPTSEVTNTAGVVVGSWLAGANLGQSNINTVVTSNIIFDQYYGVWTQGPNPPRLFRNAIWVTQGGSRYFVAPTS